MVKELDYKELELLIEEVTQKVREEIITANRCGTLEEILNKYNYVEEQEKWYAYSNTSKMIIIGSKEINNEKYGYI